MTMRLAGAAVALAASLAGCEFPSGAGERQEVANQIAEARAAAGAEGKAEEGRLSIQAPGVDIAINVPEAMRGRARAGTDSDVLPPGAQVSGIHIQGDGGAGGQAGGEAAGDSVELRFSSATAPAEIAAWYRDPARHPHFRIDSARREGEEVVLSGTNIASGGRLTARLRARGTGTDGRLVMVDRD
jgi:hypothetical protein